MEEIVVNTGHFVYPRLSDGVGLQLLNEMRTAASFGTIRRMVASGHAEAVAVPTGGAPISSVELENLRNLVVEELGDAVVLDKGIIGDRGKFDRVLGRSLYQNMAIVHSDAAHREVWTFLSTVVFPDLVYARFPDLHQDRVLGRPRNTLRRVWEREAVLGDLQEQAEKPLGEDELTGLFERTSVSRNSRLVRAVAKNVLNYTGQNRSEYMRTLMIRITKLTGPFFLDVLTDDALEKLVDETSENLMP